MADAESLDDIQVEVPDESKDSESTSEQADISVRCVKALENLRSVSEALDPATLADSFAQMQALFDEDKVLLAGKVLEQMDATFETHPEDERCLHYKQLFEGEGEEATRVASIRHSYSKCKFGLEQFISHDGWLFSQEFFGTKTWYKSHGDGVVEIKMEAIIEDLNVNNFITVFREADYYNTWVPFCTGSKMLKRDGRNKTVFYAHLPIPLLNRDTVMAATFVDSSDLGFFLSFTESVDEYPGVEIPPIDGWFLARIHLYAWNTLVEPLDENRFRTLVTLKVDLKSSLPSTLLQFVMRKVAGMFLYVLSKAARKFQNNPEKSVYSPLVEGDPDFYANWFHGLTEKCVRTVKEEEAAAAAAAAAATTTTAGGEEGADHGGSSSGATHG